MYKIIKYGHIFLETSCPKCDCEFLFESDDIEDKENILDNNGCTARTDYVLTCPFCKQKIIRSNFEIKKKSSK